MKKMLLALLCVAWLVPYAQDAWSQCQFCYEHKCFDSDTGGFVSCLPGCTLGPSCDVAVGCFLAGAQVETTGGLKAIEDVQVGDEVLGVTEDGELSYGRVTRTYRVIQYEYYLINGAIEVTGAHPFQVGSSWVNAEELVVGDVLSGMGGARIPVETIENIDFGVRAYNLEVEGTHTFFIDGILVHNKPPTPGQG